MLRISLLLLWSACAGACDFCPNNLNTYYTDGPVGDLENWNLGWFGPADGGRYYTCNDLYLAVLGGSPLTRPGFDGTCNSAKTNFDRACCYGEGTQAPNAAPSQTQFSYPLGIEPECDICKHGDRPKVNAQIFSNFIPGGSQSCLELYGLGRTKNIQGAICYPLQIFAHGPCSCDDTAAPTGSGPSIAPAPTPQPTIPNREVRPDQYSKNLYKLAYLSGYRTCRGGSHCFVNRQLEKGEDSSKLRGVYGELSTPMT